MPEQLLDAGPQVLGYYVKHVSEANPAGRSISRVFHAKSAAEEFAVVARRHARSGDQIFVTEKLGRDGV